MDLWLILGVVVAVGGVALLIAVIWKTDPIPSSESYDRRWMAAHQWCPVCGRHMEWVEEETHRFDPATGVEYGTSVWSCPIPNHTFNGLIECCLRRTEVPR